VIEATGIPVDDEPLNTPKHVAIIMDGNNRWAKSRRLPGVGGHRVGVETVRTILNACEEFNIPYLTLFAFSSENWQRPRPEVEALMSLFLSYLKKEARELRDNGVCLRVIGDRSRFSKKLAAAIAEAEAITENAGARVLTLAADYGGQWDIAQAARRLVQDVQAGNLSADAIDGAVFDRYTCLADLPKPDLCIRTGGDHRISNFLLWQLAYAELYFTDVYWPDFDRAAFVRALEDYSGRQRRFGRTGDQIEADQC
jgi:undecaprenyl diphosphate synthase